MERRLPHFRKTSSIGPHAVGIEVPLPTDDPDLVTAGTGQVVDGAVAFSYLVIRARDSDALLELAHNLTVAALSFERDAEIAAHTYPLNVEKAQDA